MMNIYYKIGGSLNPKHPTYVTRKADQELFNYLQQKEYCVIFNSRQMGKSSLRVRVAKKLYLEGNRCAMVDISLIEHSVTSQKWYYTFAELLLDSLELDFNLDSYWNQNTSKQQNLYELLQLILFNHISSPLVIFIDEIDSLMGREFKDDFFAFIRACYNKRAEEAEESAFNRLTFCLIGVISPNDLIQDKSRTPFNIGHNIDLTGFTFEESKNALILGLASRFAQPEKLLQEILNWTGGQPFLTQKLCSLVLEKSDSHSPNISDIVNTYIINNWESQDEPEHLRTIRDRLLKHDEQVISSLELYRKILLEKSIIYNNNNAQIELRLTGLVTHKNNHLIVYNPIYATIFNPDWINYQLSQQRPYSDRLNPWLDSQKDPQFLLQGSSLQEALQWAKNKDLSPLDYQFLAASKTEEDRQTNDILAQANQKAAKLLKRTVTIAIAILATTGFYSYHKINKAQTMVQLEQSGNEIQKSFESNQIQGLEKAMESVKKLKTIVDSRQSIADYPTITPIATLLNILNQITLKEQIKLELNNSSDVKKITITQFEPQKNLIISGHLDGTVNLWNLEGKLLKTQKTQGKFQETDSPIVDIKFSPNHQMIAAINRDGILTIWDQEGTLIKTVKTLTEEEFQQNDRVYTLQFTPDSQFIAVGMNGKIKIWQTQGTLFKELSLVNSDKSIRVYSLAFSSDSQLLISGCEDGKIRIWRKEGQLKNIINAHANAINSVIFEPNDQSIISGGQDGKIQRWTLTGELTKTLSSDDYPILRLNFDSNNQVLAATNSQGQVKLLTLKNENSEQILPHNSKALSADFQSDSQQLITINQEGMINVWKISSSVSNLTPISSISYTPDHQLIAVGKFDGTIELYNKELKLLKAVKTSEETSEIRGIFFHPNHQSFFIARWDGIIQEWTTDGQLSKTLLKYQGDIQDISFNPSEQTFAIVNEKGEVDKFFLEGKLIEKNLIKDQNVTRIAFHPNGKILAFSSRENSTLNWWQIQKRYIVKTEFYPSFITDLNFSPDGKILALSDSNNTAQLWQQKDMTVLMTLNNFQSEVTSLSFSPEGNRLIIGNQNGQVSQVFLTPNDLMIQSCNWLKKGCFNPPS